MAQSMPKLICIGCTGTLFEVTLADDYARYTCSNCNRAQILPKQQPVVREHAEQRKRRLAFQAGPRVPGETAGPTPY
jgi:hypothetical protein